MNAAAMVVNIREGRNSAASNVVELAKSRNFNEYVRRATDDELIDTERALAAELAMSEASGVRTQLMEVIKERLQVVSKALAVSL